MSDGDAAGWVCPMSDGDAAGWVCPMLDGDAAVWACPMLNGDAAVWVAPTFRSAAFSMSSKRSYNCKKRTEVAVSRGKGLKGSMQSPVEVACASL